LIRIDFTEIEGRTSSFLRDFDRNFRAVGLRKPGLVFKPRRNSTIADLMRIAELIEFEQLACQRLAAGVSLASILVDMNFELSGHPWAPLFVARIALHLSLRDDYSEAVSIHQRPNGRLTKLPVLAAAIDG
jgi:hypothetical protein